MDFQEELKQNLRSAETVENEARQQELAEMKAEAAKSLKEIKYRLLESAKYARTETKDGVTSVYCFYQLPYHYMSFSRGNNDEELRANAKLPKLLRDPNLKYHSWTCYDVEPENSTKYYLYIWSLRELAAAEKISIETVIYDSKANKMASFPAKLSHDYGSSWRLCVRATSVVSVDENYKPEQTTSSTLQKQPVEDITPKEETFEVRNTQNSEGPSLGKILFVLVLLIAAIVLLCVTAINEYGLGVDAVVLMFVVGSIVLGYKMLSK